MGIWEYFCFGYTSGLCTMQEPSIPPLVSILFRMALTQIITWVYNNSLTLNYPQNIKIWLVIQFLYPQVGFVLPLLMLFIDIMHPPKYWSKIGCNQVRTCFCRLVGIDNKNTANEACRIRVYIRGIRMATGVGKSQKLAKRDAAEKALIKWRVVFGSL